MDKNSTDYSKYKYVRVTGDLYSNYRLENFNFKKSENKQLQITNREENTSNISSNKDVIILRKKIELNSENNINCNYDNIKNKTNANMSRSNEVSTNKLINKSNSKANFNIKKGDNDKSIINNSKNKSTFKGKNSYQKFIDELDIDSIVKQVDKENELDNTSINTDNNICDNENNQISLHNIEDERSTKSSRFDYKDKKDKKSNKKNKVKGERTKGGVINGFIILLIFVVTFFLCNFLLPNSLNIETKEFFVYAVSKSAISVSDAKSISNSFSSYGAGGNIYEEEGNFYVIADMFNTYENAESVMKNSNNYNSFDTINKLYVKKYCFNGVEANLTNNISSVLNYIDICYFNLQKIALLYNQKDIDKVEAKQRVSRNLEELNRLKKFFDNNTKKSSNIKVIKIRSQLEFSVSILNDIIGSENFSHKIRAGYISILLNHINIINDSYIK